MFSILLALVVIRRHLTKIGRIDIYQRIYYELQNLNLEDEISIDRVTEIIKTLLSDNVSLAKMIIHLINQCRPGSSEQTVAMAEDLLCHKTPELSNLNHKIFRVVQKILPKTSESPINTNQIFQPIPSSTQNSNEASVTSTAHWNVPIQSCSAAISPMIFTISKSVGSPVLGNNPMKQPSSNVIKLVQVGKTIQSTGKNLRVLSLYDNLVEVNPTSHNKDNSVLEKVTSHIGNSTHLYTINNMKLACLSSSRSITSAPMTTKLSSAAANSSVVQKSIKAMTQPSTLQTLLTAAQVVDKMSTLKGKKGMQTGMPITVLCGAKNPLNSGVLSALANVVNPKNRTQVGIPGNGVKTITISEKIPFDSCEPLDFSIRKSSRQNSSYSLLNTCKGDKNKDDDDDDDENALIVVDDDDKYTPDDKDCRVELEEIVLKNEPHSQEENSFETNSTGRSHNEVTLDIDQSQPFLTRRRRKRNCHLLDD